MQVLARRISLCALAWLLVAAAPLAHSTVSVTVPDPNTAVANVSLDDGHGHTYSAVVTLVFDVAANGGAINLSADSLGLSAELIDPASPPGTLPSGVSVDPAFPVMLTVEPPVALFLNGYENGQVSDGNLAFHNTYEMEVHTDNLVCGSSTSAYRLYKAPHGSAAFGDVTDDIYQGSVRARGRGGAFSRFIVARDSRPGLTIALQKLLDLTTRLNLATITNGTLLTNLVATLSSVSLDLLTLNISGAVLDLQTFIDNVAGAAGTDIANVWKADRSVNNDAGELLSLAQTLQFTLRLLQGGSPLCVPPPA